MSRYLFSISSNAWLEIQWQMFAGIFLLGGAYVLQVNEHVRVDLFYGSAPPRRKLWIDVIGIPLFLFPVGADHRLLRLGILPVELRDRRDLVQRRRAAALAGKVPVAARALRCSSFRACRS